MSLEIGEVVALKNKKITVALCIHFIHEEKVVCTKNVCPKNRSELFESPSLSISELLLFFCWPIFIYQSFFAFIPLLCGQAPLSYFLDKFEKYLKESLFNSTSSTS